MSDNNVQFLIDAASNSVGSVNNDGWMPLHCLCNNVELDESAAMEILKLLIEKHPEAVRHADNDGVLPIHHVGGWRSPEFCRVLFEAYPGSQLIANHVGFLPLHCACLRNTVTTAKYLHKLYPAAINHATTSGLYPIHAAIGGMSHRNNPITAVHMVQFLLECDPNVKFQKVHGRMSLLFFACRHNYTDSNIYAGLQIIKVIYDAHPEAIESDEITSNIHQYHQQVRKFINSQLVHSRQAKNHRLMTTPDEKGQLPLHIALQNNVRLGSIKLLVKGNPCAIQNSDNNLAMPLHVACQHHDSVSVIQYLFSLGEITLHAVDVEQNTALHYACRGAKYDTIALLLEKFDALSVSKWNAHKKLPIDLLFESDGVLDRNSVEYTESVFRLLKAYPETLMNISVKKQQSTSVAFPSSSGKKRKFGDV